MIAFHATRIERLPKILTEGLRTGRRRTWSDGSGRKIGSRKLIYLGAREAEAICWARKMEFDLGCKACVIVLTIDEHLLTPDPHIQGRINDYAWFTTDQNIASDSISHVLPLTRDRVRGAIAALNREDRQAA